MAVASKNDVITQLRVIAFIEKSFSMAGNAMFTDDIRKVERKDVMATMPAMESCVFVQCILVMLIIFFLWVN
jgi:hypothetical protein